MGTKVALQVPVGRVKPGYRTALLPLHAQSVHRIV